MADQEAREALFINGIRRVGKTSLLNKLEAAPPQGVHSVLVQLDLADINSTGGFFHFLAYSIQKSVANKYGLDSDFLGIMSTESKQAFMEQPQYTFPDFLEKVSAYLNGQKLLLLIDEFQLVTEAIKRSREEGTTSKLDVPVLDMFRRYIENRAFLTILTGSSLYSEVQEYLPGYNRLWGTLTPQDIGFVNNDSVGQILRIPAKRYQIVYTDASIQRAYDHTQGYPWFVQMIGTEIVAILKFRGQIGGFTSRHRCSSE